MDMVRRPTRVIRARRWRSLRWATLFKRFLHANPRDPRGPTAIASCSAQGMRACCSTRCCTSPAMTGVKDLEGFRQWGSRTPGHRSVVTRRDRDHDRPARPGVRERGGNGDGRALPADRFNRPGSEVVDHHTYVDLLGRGHDGGGQPGSGVDRRALRARQADRLLRRQPHHDRWHAPRSPSTARITWSDWPPTAGTCSGWRLRGSRGAHGGDRGGARRRRAALVHLDPLAHRLSRPARRGHRESPRLGARRG